MVKAAVAELNRTLWDMQGGRVRGRQSQFEALQKCRESEGKEDVLDNPKDDKV